MNQVSQRLSFREKAGYALGDAATNFFFQSMLYYQNKYYTDVYGLSASALGWMLMIVRWWDAFFDPLIGTLADRTNSRWGKFRPWVLFTALPYGVLFWLAFTTPDFGPNGKLIYAYVTYTLLMMIYSANNTPYSALNGVMTGDVNERTSVSTYRFVAAMTATLIVQGLVWPLVDKLGHGNAVAGWSRTIGIFGALMVGFSIIAFFSARERVKPDPQQKSSVKQDIVDVFHCRPWVIMFALTLMIFTTLSMRGGSLNYLFTYYLDRQSLMDFLASIGLAGVTVTETSSWGVKLLDTFGLIVAKDGSNAPSVAFGFINMVGNAVTILGVLSSKPLAVRFGKKTVFLIGMSITTVATAAIFWVQPKAVGALFWLSLLWPAAWGPTIPLLWAMIADVADYSEWTTGRRATGFVYAGIVFALKAGLGVGGAIGSWILAAYGYAANAAQTEQSMLGIRLCPTIYSAIPFAIGVACLAIYPISKELNLRIGDELAERRKKFAQS
jgi:GPH family glycoside/pentoside/hexuronide:cation symporter